MLLNEASPTNSRVKKGSSSFYNIVRRSDFLEGDKLEATSIFTSEPYKVRSPIPDPKQQQPPKKEQLVTLKQ